ncbi:SRPBCC domain-containing protein [Gryllotalpicola ginsengisoli]|uniref:SRPBCC domain-containing protein n=1 Tax=Gryllotalpicola ginsengisoli TaxID=444608 RepID=UPI0003B328E9|nr:SRPBCC domain-containing protein [Gryllotalpicola ginsengisoli]
MTHPIAPRTVIGTVEESVLVGVEAGDVWAAFAELERRAQWFRMPGTQETHVLDFRIGGEERLEAVFSAAERVERIDYRSRFLDLVPQERIVAATELRLDDVLRVVTLDAVELDSADDGTRIRLTQQYQSLHPVGDGRDDRGERRGGARFLLRRLALYLENTRQV